MTDEVEPTADIVVPIERGHEIRKERAVAWVGRSLDAMTSEQRVECLDAVKFAVAALAAQEKPHADR